jgi:hypothetical protein
VTLKEANMSVIAVVAALCVVATFGWIVVDAFRSKKKDVAIQLQHETRSVMLSTHLQPIGEVETKVRKSVEEIQRLRLAVASSPDMTPPEMEAVDPNQDETRCMKAVREKAEEVERLAKRKAKA